VIIKTDKIVQGGDDIGTVRLLLQKAKDSQMRKFTPLRRVVGSRQDDDRQVAKSRCLTQEVQGVNPIDERHVDIEQNDMRRH